jgi:predicted MFS family arabinose efflux permease
VPDRGAVAETTHARTREKDLRRLVAAVGVSALGTWSYNVGIAVYAFQEAGSTAWVAAATVGRYVPALVITAVGSRWADRLPRRRVALAADAFCAVVMALLTLLALGHGPIVVAIGLAALSSGVARLQSAAVLASAADLVPESRLTHAAASLSTTDSVATAVGPALASIVLAVASPAVLFALNGASFAVSLVLVAGITGLRALPATGGRADRAGDEGGYRAAVRVVWPLLALRTIAAAVYGADVVLLAVVATNQLRQGTGGYGWLLAAAGAGGLVAAAWLRSHHDRQPVARRSVLGLAAYALPLLGFLAAPPLPGSLAVQLVRGAGSVVVLATTVAGLQRAVPGAASGRVFGLNHVLVMVGTSAGALVVPGLLNAVGFGSTLAVVALLPLVAALILLPAVVRFDREGAARAAALDPRVDVLRRLALFADASRSTLYAVADQAEELVLPPLTTLVRQGDPSDALYVLLDGTVDVLADTAGGTVPLRTMRAPAYLGEIGLLHGGPRTATVVTATDVRVWRIPAEAFLRAVAFSGVSGSLSDGMRHRLDASALVRA